MNDAPRYESHDPYYQPRRPMGLMNFLVGLGLLILIVFAGVALWPHVSKQFGGVSIVIATPAPTARPTPQPRPTPLPSAQQMTGNPNVASSPAEADALYATAVAAQQQPAPDPNVYNPVRPTMEAAIFVPTISAAQAENYASRGSGSCPAGQVFVPRSGCHTPGSGGAMPGAVGP